MIVAACLTVAIVPTNVDAQAAQPKRKLPNILWITSEDHGPHLGCYGDKLARTPNLDKLAAKGMRYRMCWSNAPVCAPARTAIITGMYPTSLGAEHMRSLVSMPADMQMFPALLRALGYYCSNRVKEDYNVRKTGKVWDDSSNKAHYRNRSAGMPFFAVFNSVKSHESQLRGYKLPTITDPAKVRVPAYHPDVPEVRNDWARYYDIVSLVDADAGVLLRELEELGLLEDTIIFYFADHGPGMPRSKRTPLNSGLQVPMIVYFPENWKHLAPPEYRPGGVSDRLVSFVDLAPTMLSLAGEPAPQWMQGRAFAGKHIQLAPEFLHGFRGRMDERYDMQRSVTDGRYVLLINYMPRLPSGQHVEYMFQTRTTQVWKEMFDLDKLNVAQRRFWEARRSPVELYDLQIDPDEVNDLQGKQSRPIFDKLMQAAVDQAFLLVLDIGFLPEDEIHTRSVGITPYELARDHNRCPLSRIVAMAADSAITSPQFDRSVPALRKGLQDEDSAVRFWAAHGLLNGGLQIVAKNGDLLRMAEKDKAPSVAIVAAQALAHFGTDDDLIRSRQKLLSLAQPKNNSIYIRLAALNALDRLGDKARPGLATIKSWPTDVPKDDRAAAGIPRLIHKIVKQLEN
jgi:uncharacterized sulfatase